MNTATAHAPTPPAKAPDKTYVIREIFHSVQGEGAWAGSVNVFVRFAFCNLQCVPEKDGFSCDTDFHHGDRMTAAEIVAAVRAADTSPGGCGRIIFTGGEPTLQLDRALCVALWDVGYALAIETNGTRRLPIGLDWVSVSPKPGHPTVLDYADECRIVLRAGQQPDEGQLAMADRSDLSYVSPSFDAPDKDHINGFVGGPGDLPKANADWCVAWAKAHPGFRVSLQTHKFLGVR